MGDTHLSPASTDDVFLGMIAAKASNVYRLRAHGYATSWFVTPYFAASLLLSFAAIDARRAFAPAATAVPASRSLVEADARAR